MFFDEQVSKPKVDVFSLEGLIAWLEKQPAGKRYDWHDPAHCLIAQWLAAEHGYSDPVVRSNKSCDLTANLDSDDGVTVLGRIAYGGRNPQYTYGAALERAKAARALQSGDNGRPAR